jgi:hypothetical protein
VAAMRPTFHSLALLVLASSTLTLGGLYWYKHTKQVRSRPYTPQPPLP